MTFEELNAIVFPMDRKFGHADFASGYDTYLGLKSDNSGVYVKQIEDSAIDGINLPPYCIIHEWRGPVDVDGEYIVKRNAMVIEFGSPCTDCL